MRRLWFVVMCAVGILLQLSLLPALRPFGVVPDLALVLVVLVALEGTASLALVLAVAGGLALDLASGAQTGLWMGILILAALAGGLMHRAGIETDGLLVPAVIVAAGTLVMDAVVVGGFANAVADWPVWFMTGRVMTELVLNLVLILGVRPLVRRLVPKAPLDIAAMG